LLLLVGRPSIEPHVILSTAVLLVAPLWRTITIPLPASLPLPPMPLFFCTLAQRTLQPTPIVGVKVIEGALGPRPEITAATVHRRRRGFANETRGSEVGSRSAPPPRHVSERNRRGRNEI
jgi:hypothetical protein